MTGITPVSLASPLTVAGIFNTNLHIDGCIYISLFLGMSIACLLNLSVGVVVCSLVKVQAIV